MASKKFTGTLSLELGTLRFIQQAQKYPLLSKETEQDCARRWRDHNDKDALQVLVNSHLRMVVKVAMVYRRYSVPVEELISEGTVGLMQAVQRFDPDRGFRLSTYALWWIRTAVLDFIVNNWSMVKMGKTKEQKKLFLKLRRTKARMQFYEDGDMSDEQVRQIASHLQVSETDVVMVNRRLAGQDTSLNAPTGEGGEAELQDWLIDDAERHDERLARREELAYRYRAIREAMDDLTERERRIVTERYFRDDAPSLERLSKRMGISRERVRQIEVGAVANIKKRLDRCDRNDSLTQRSLGPYPRPRLRSSTEAARQKLA